jgi:hypothetical protein
MIAVGVAGFGEASKAQQGDRYGEKGRSVSPLKPQRNTQFEQRRLKDTPAREGLREG